MMGCSFPPKPITDAVPSNGITCFVGESAGPFIEFTSCNPEVIRKETKSTKGADLISFQAAYQGQGSIAVSELSIMRIVSPAQLKKGEKDSVKKYRAVFDVGQDKYSNSLHVEDSNCTFSFRIGKDGNVRVWRLTHISIIRGAAGMSPAVYCASEKRKWENPRAFIRISTEKTSNK
jgi:hypothetical protein